MAKARARSKKLGLTMDPYQQERDVERVNVEVEPRGFSSAVSRGGRMTAKECYRCLTTVCRNWHSYGKLELELCNACVVLLHQDVCGYCGYEACDESDRVLFNCRICSRGTHKSCEAVSN